MIPHMTPAAISKVIASGDNIFDDSYECFYTAIIKSDSLSESIILAESWGYNAMVYSETWYKALADAKAVMGDSIFGVDNET